MSSFQSPNLGTGEESGDDWVLVEENKCISQQLTALEILSSRNFACLGHLGGCGLQKREHYTPPCSLRIRMVKGDPLKPLSLVA